MPASQEFTTMHDVTHVVQPFRLATAPDQPVGLAAGTLDDALALPLVECLTLEHGRCFVDHRLTQTAVGSGLRPIRREPLTSPWPGTRVIQHDPGSKLTVTVDLWHPTPGPCMGIQPSTMTARIRSTSQPSP